MPAREIESSFLLSGTEGSPSSPGVNESFPFKRVQFPDLVMPMRIGSYLLRSIASNTPLAEIQEISCSLLRPPQIMATRVLLIGARSPLQYLRASI